MNTEDLIQDLSLKAKVKVRPPWVSSTQGWSFGILFFIFLGWIYQLRPDIIIKLQEPKYQINLLLLFSSSIFAAVTACRISIPGFKTKPIIYVLTFLPFSLWAVNIVVKFGKILFFNRRAIQIEMMDFFCFWNFLLFLLIPGAFYFYQLKCLAPVKTAWSGALAVLFATSIGNFSLLLLEQNDQLYHQLAWHVTPTVIFIMLGALLGGKILHW